MGFPKRLATLALGAGALLLLKFAQKESYSFSGKSVLIAGG